MDDIHFKILDFIKRRFKTDCNWLNGNCYYFALILSDRFSGGEICYDVIYGHFVFAICERYYDWTGEVSPKGKLVKWSEFDKYDQLVKKRVVNDCLR